MSSATEFGQHARIMTLKLLGERLGLAKEGLISSAPQCATAAVLQAQLVHDLFVIQNAGAGILTDSLYSRSRNVVHGLAIIMAEAAMSSNPPFLSVSAPSVLTGLAWPADH